MIYYAIIYIAVVNIRKTINLKGFTMVRTTSVWTRSDRGAAAIAAVDPPLPESWDEALDVLFSRLCRRLAHYLNATEREVRSLFGFDEIIRAIFFE